MDLMWPLMLLLADATAPPIANSFLGTLGTIVPSVSVCTVPPSIQAAKSFSAKANAAFPPTGLGAAEINVKDAAAMLF